jgi:hypothetical protein
MLLSALTSFQSTRDGIAVPGVYICVGSRMAMVTYTQSAIMSPQVLGNIDVWNISLVTAWNLGCCMVTSKFPASNIKGMLLELESKGYDMEFPFREVVESLEEFDNDDECNGAPVMPDAELLSAEGATALISLFKLGEGECLILSYDGSHTQAR